MNTRIPRTAAEMRQFDETGLSRRQTAGQREAEKQMKAAEEAYQKELGTYRPGVGRRLQTLLKRFFK
ncbi:hypothetical protein [Allofournierella massiliensis]|uniref:hypothetical protein n=1 Tax=Allofournierella massiliensis TaxID=1650663 RepID=UPI000B3795E5|nr:hypothetical protein [uncultured Fournierella sp.]OUN16532.1 hypothetical protein B5G38_04765 [Gemmiger sp. An87]